MLGQTTSANFSVGVFGLSGAGTGSVAGKFSGDVDVIGNLTKSTGTFLIDHPLDPANRTLEHSFVESPERKNVYDGIVTADASGEATITLPGYMEALNQDFRYQLTAIGAAAPGLYIKREVANGEFAIAGAGPGQRISWQLTGNRKDAVALARPMVVERDKDVGERGYYLNPEAFGLPSERSVVRKRYSIPDAAPPPPVPLVKV